MKEFDVFAVIILLRRHTFFLVFGACSDGSGACLILLTFVLAIHGVFMKGWIVNGYSVYGGLNMTKA
jgi:hypothetical protein